MTPDGAPGAGGGGRPLLVALRALKLGDLLVAVPALRALALALPDHRRVLAAPAWLAPLAAATGAVDEVVDTAPLADLDPRLHRRRRRREPPRAGSAEHRGAAAEPPPPPRRLRRAGSGAVGGRRARAGAVVPAPPRRRDGRRPARPPPRAPRRRAAAGSGGRHARPPRRVDRRTAVAVERFAAVAAAEVAAGRPVAVTGSAEERPLALAVAHAAGLDGGVVLAGRTDLTGLLAAVAAAGRVVCGDTGVAHVATALATPSVLLFGPTSPATWGPPPGGPHEVLWAGRTGDPLGEEPDPGLLELAVDDVVAALDRLPLRAASA